MTDYLTQKYLKNFQIFKETCQNDSEGVYRLLSTKIRSHLDITWSITSMPTICLTKSVNFETQFLSCPPLGGVTSNLHNLWVAKYTHSLMGISVFSQLSQFLSCPPLGVVTSNFHNLWVAKYTHGLMGFSVFLQLSQFFLNSDKCQIA